MVISILKTNTKHNTIEEKIILDFDKEIKQLQETSTTKE